MTISKFAIHLGVVFLGALGGLHLTAFSGWAAEGEKSWRATYDLVMMWVNFGILAFLLAKYARAPLINLLRGEGKKTARAIEEVADGKKLMAQKLQDTIAALDSSRERLRSVKERIIRDGERKKQEIIESARQDSQIMLEQTRTRIDHQVSEARERLKAELIDLTVEAALERLPHLMTVDDQKRLVEKFIKEA
jgi:F-type H+-transporting ATPase subunit b